MIKLATDLLFYLLLIDGLYSFIRIDSKIMQWLLSFECGWLRIYRRNDLTKEII